jgi:hypothetical protein
MRAPVLPKQGFRAASDDFAKQQLQGAVQQQNRAANVNPLQQAIWLQGIAVPAASSLKVAHNLGATPRGYVVTKSLGTGSGYVSAMDSTSITIFNPAASAVTFDLMVF